MTALERYVAEVARLMKLGDWDIELVDTTAADEARASISAPTYWNEPAQLYFNPKDWAEATPELRRMLVVHELMHLHLAPYEYVVNQLRGDGDLSTDLQDEIVVGHLTAVIAPHMPLPGPRCKP
jgi:hypothetical protein